MAENSPQWLGDGAIPSRQAASFTAPGPSTAPRPSRDLVARSLVMRELRDQLARVARTRATVLLCGETGTGKGHAARYLHRASAGPDEPFVHADCASLAASVIESELFGHERGAFTGAHERRIGRFERAGNGTIFLDEIAEIAPELQAKLLRVLEEREFERVGGVAPLPVRARVVAATNRDLRDEIREGRFRADLFYRLQVCELRLPPLRERLEDLPALLEVAIDVVASVPGGTRPRVLDGFVERLRAHAWPGNVRELKNLVERLAISRPDGPWGPRDVDAVLRAPLVTGRPEPAPDSVRMLADSRRLFDATERQELARTLGSHRWNVSAAARSLGLSRGALRGRMARLGLS